MNKQTANPFQIVSDKIMKQILALRLKIHVQSQIIPKKWNMQINHITIQIFQFEYLIEEWNIQTISTDPCLQFNQEALDQFYREVDAIIAQMTLNGRDQGTLHHILIYNETTDRMSNWDDLGNITVLQAQLQWEASTVTVSVAYTPKKVRKQEVQAKGRARFLSDDLNQVPSPKSSRVSVTQNSMHNHSFDGGGWKQPTKKDTTVMSVFSKKDDVEIVSSPEEVEKIMGSNSDDDFEISFVIVQLDFNMIISDHRKKLVHSSVEIKEILDFVMKY